LIWLRTKGNKPGDVLQGVIADPVLVDSQPVVPNDTRALLTLKEIQKPKHDFADVTLQLTGLIFKSGKLQVNVGPVKARLQFLSDVNVLTRGVVGIIGGAMGAAGGRVYLRIGPDRLHPELRVPTPLRIVERPHETMVDRQSGRSIHDIQVR
jgi:hypothetical protein